MAGADAGIVPPLIQMKLGILPGLYVIGTQTLSIQAPVLLLHGVPGSTAPR